MQLQKKNDSPKLSTVKDPFLFSTYELPFHAIDYCLKIADIHLNNVGHIAYSFDPYLLLGDEKGKAKIEISLGAKMSGLSKWMMK